jgi:hypothetical protein
MISLLSNMNDEIRAPLAESTSKYILAQLMKYLLPIPFCGVTGCDFAEIQMSKERKM